MPSKTARRDAGAGALYQDARGLWTASITLTPDPTTGARRRRVVRSRDRATASRKLRELRAELDRAGDLPTSSPSLAQWATYWLDEIYAARVSPRSLAGRRGDLHNHILPLLGRKKLDKLTPADVIALRNHIIEHKQLASSTALRCHRLLSVCLRDARRAGKVGRNVATTEYVDAPSPGRPQIQLLDVDQTITLLDKASEDTVWAARWATTLLSAQRQAEVLGAETDRVILDGPDPRLDLSWQLQRITYSHGCARRPGDPPRCGRKRGADCPDRSFRIREAFEARQIAGGLHLVRPKSGSRRILPLVDPLLTYLRAHLDQHDGASPLVFTEKDGRPIDQRDDSARWRALLEQAGVPQVRQHDARHGAATLMLALGVDPHIVQAILGHSSVAMTRHYQHVDQRMAREALTKMSAALAPSSP